jgi:hypothetical protein
MEELTALEAELGPLEARATELRGQIKDTMLAYTLNKVIVRTGMAQMVSSSRTSFDSKTLQREAPDLYARYLRTATFTNLRITSKGVDSCLSTAS